MKTSASKYLLFATLLSLTGCTFHLFDPAPEPVPTLPEITETGKNTLGFKINGVIAAARYKISATKTPTYLAIDYDDATLFDGRFYKMSIHKHDATDLHIGTYDLNNYPTTETIIWSEKTGCIDFDGDFLTNGTLSITHLDTVKHIIAGKFEFTTVLASPCDTLRVTEGRFDLVYSDYE